CRGLPPPRNAIGCRRSERESERAGAAAQAAAQGRLASAAGDLLGTGGAGNAARACPLLGPGGFDPAADILGITVNRWPHGYAYTYDSLSDPDVPEEQRPHVRGRQAFGRIAIANSDAGAAAFMNEAIDQARRAVDELVRRSGLT